MSFTLSGTVTDAVSHAPIPNVLVKIISAAGSNFGKSAVTNGSGQYSIAGLSAGTMIVEAYIGGYQPADTLLTLTANATHDFALAHAHYTLSGIVTDAATGAPIQDALVKIVAGSGSNFGKSAITDGSGHYAISGLNPGTIIVEAALAYVPKGQLLSMAANATQNFALSK